MSLTIEIIRRLEEQVPELKDKIQTGAVDAETKPPYAVCTNPEETPIRTIHGIAGYRTTFDVGVYDPRKSMVDTLKTKVIEALEGWRIGTKRVYYTNGADDFIDAPDRGLFVHAFLLTFKIV